VTEKQRKWKWWEGLLDYITEFAANTKERDRYIRANTKKKKEHGF
jgi:hypothetical protein